MSRLVIVEMGVSGSGKTSIGSEAAARLGWPYQEGDDLHPAANIAKMSSGQPLEDADRWPWLERVAAWIDGQLAAGEPGLVSCSLLKRAYRDLVIGQRPNVRLLYLRGSKQVIAERAARRKGHFMPPSLLDSQFETLEEPGPEERPLVVDIEQPLEACIASAVALIRAA